MSLLDLVFCPKLQGERSGMGGLVRVRTLHNWKRELLCALHARWVNLLRAKALVVKVRWATNNY